jgi:uncharacterized membrane protein YkgB
MTAYALRIQKVGRNLALIGIILPLLLIGGLKFTTDEIEGIKSLLGATPWLSWLLALFGKNGASYFLGIVEIAAALLLIGSFWSARAGVLGGLIATLTFFVTSTLLLLPIAWDPNYGFPALAPAGQFLVKDVTLLGVAIFVLGDSLARLRAERPAAA